MPHSDFTRKRIGEAPLLDISNPRKRRALDTTHSEMNGSSSTFQDLSDTGNIVHPSSGPLWLHGDQQNQNGLNIRDNQELTFSNHNRDTNMEVILSTSQVYLSAQRSHTAHTAFRIPLWRQWILSLDAGMDSLGEVYKGEGILEAPEWFRIEKDLVVAATKLFARTELDMKMRWHFEQYLTPFIRLGGQSEPIDVLMGLRQAFIDDGLVAKMKWDEQRIKGLSRKPGASEL